jgi:hypothetical protein
MDANGVIAAVIAALVINDLLEFVIVKVLNVDNFQ